MDSNILIAIAFRVPRFPRWIGWSETQDIQLESVSSSMRFRTISPPGMPTPGRMIQG